MYPIIDQSSCDVITIVANEKAAAVWKDWWKFSSAFIDIFLYNF